MSMNTFVLPGLDFVLERRRDECFFAGFCGHRNQIGESELPWIFGILQVDTFGLFSVSRKNGRNRNAVESYPIMTLFVWLQFRIRVLAASAAMKS